MVILNVKIILEVQTGRIGLYVLAKSVVMLGLFLKHAITSLAAAVTNFVSYVLLLISNMLITICRIIVQDAIFISIAAPKTVDKMVNHVVMMQNLIQVLVLLASIRMK